MIRPKNSRGFTLPELIIVIVVLGILATIVTGSFNAYLQYGRDAERGVDIRIIASGMDRYYRKNLAYPFATAGHTSAGDTTTAADLKTALLAFSQKESFQNPLTGGTCPGSGTADNSIYFLGSDGIITPSSLTNADQQKYCYFLKGGGADGTKGWWIAYKKEQGSCGCDADWVIVKIGNADTS